MNASTVASLDSCELIVGAPDTTTSTYVIEGDSVVGQSQPYMDPQLGIKVALHYFKLLAFQLLAARSKGFQVHMGQLAQLGAGELAQRGEKPFGLVDRIVRGLEPVIPPATTMLGVTRLAVPGQMVELEATAVE